MSTSGHTVFFEEENDSPLSASVTFSCTFTAPVSACGMSPTHQTIASGDIGFSTLTYAVGSSEGTGTVTVKGVGINGTFTATVTVEAAKKPVVTPKALALGETPSTAYTQPFAVTNPSSVFSATVALTASCTSTVSCTPVSTPLTLAAGVTDTVTVSYTTGSTGPTGTVALRAAWSTASALADSGYANVTFDFLQVATTATNNDNQNLGLCAAGCFTATYAQSTVPYLSLNTPRGVTLAYHGDRMSVRPFVAVDVSLRANAPTLQQYWLQAKVNWGAGWTTVTFLNGEQTLHFAPNPTHQVRLAGQFDASTHATGAYPLQILVTAQYPTYNETFVDSSQHLLVVNERASPIAQGWTLAGVQHLYVQPDSALLFTDGGGGATYFASGCGGLCLFAPPGEFSTVRVTGSGGSTTYTRLYPDSSRIVFNNLGQETAAADRFGTAVTFSYDGAGRLTRVYDPVRKDNTGSALTYTGLAYGASYGLAAITEPASDGTPAAGRQTTLTVGSDSTLQAIADPDGVSTSFGYDTPHRLTTIIDRRGDTTTYTYRSDSSWKLASQAAPSVPTDVGGGSTSMQRPTITVTPWQVLSVPTGATATTPATPVLTDSVLAVVTDPGGHATRFTVDHWGQPLRSTGPLGLTTTITRSGIFAVKTVSPTGAVDSAAYNSSGLLVTHIAATHDTTRITYGPYARPTQISGTGQATETFTSGAHGADSLATVVGATAAIHYYVDALGRDTMVVDPVGHTTTAHYDATFGNLDSTTAEGDRWTKTVFDHFGRDSLHLANLRPADTTTYDVLNRVTRVASPGLGATAVSYDAMYPTRVKDPKSNVYRVTVDALGRVSQRFDPADTVNRFLSYRYNLDGLLTSWTDRRGDRVDVAYDSLHRELAKSGTNVVADSFSFNPTGTITVGWNDAARDSIFTNATGWTDSVVTWLAPANKRFRRYYHHPASTTQLDSIGITSTSPIHFADRSFTWDASTARLDGVFTSAPQSNFATLAYTGEGLDSTIARAGSLTETFTHTARHELTSTSFSAGVPNFVLGRQYSYGDSLGHLTQIARANQGDGELRRFVYTAAGALSAAEIDSLTTASSCPPPTGHELQEDGYGCTTLSGYVPLQTLAMSYDSAGNRTLVTDGVTNDTTRGTYTTGNRLTGWGRATYTRDLDGNDSTKTVGSRTTTYSWTADGRLQAVTVGNVTLSYAYDAFGQLVHRSRSVNGGPAVLERQFLWDRGQLLAELDGSATHRIAEYAYWPGTDQPYALMTGDTAITATRYMEQDATGNVIGVFTSTTVPQALVYQPFGELDSAASVLGTLADTNRLRWKGLMWEGDSTRLYYVRNRWYDPQAGRFLSEDPAGLMGGLNLYAFGGNDPINARDPQGLSSDCELVPVQIFDLVDGKVTERDSEVSLCGSGGNTIGQILDYAATLGVGDGSAFWGGGEFASLAAFESTAASCTLVPPSGRFSLGPNAVALFQPAMADALSSAFANLNDEGIVPMITSGFRTAHDQLRMRNGASGPNPAARVSLHQVGLAVDFNTRDGHFAAIKDAMIAQGLTWGGNFVTRQDLPHFQLAPAGTKASPAMVAACGGN